MKIKLIKYNKKFPLYFKKEKKSISKLGNFEIHHIGSTAIPNIVGKGWIDILIIVKNKKEGDNLIKKLGKKGYKKAKTQRDYRIFLSRKKGKAQYNIHLYIGKNKEAKKQIKFKNYLLTNPEEAKKYEEFKKEMLKKSKGDRIIYKKLKEGYKCQYWIIKKLV